MRIAIKRRASNNIKKLVAYIADNGYPNTADKYALRLFDFLSSLAKYPNVYTLCKNKKWAALNYHCAVFEGTYVVPFKLKGNTLFIMNVIHGSRIK